jgi:tyrosinase
MQFPSILSVALAIVWSAAAVSGFYGKRPCTTPVVRREWRAFSVYEKSEWIRAVNVRVSLTSNDCHSETVFYLQCLSNLPHDPGLAPSVDPSVSLIPPVNASGSYYDGMSQSIEVTFGGEVLIGFFPQIWCTFIWT